MRMSQGDHVGQLPFAVGQRHQLQRLFTQTPR
jgi:hypothetical protein